MATSGATGSSASTCRWKHALRSKSTTILRACRSCCYYICQSTSWYVWSQASTQKCTSSTSNSDKRRKRSFHTVRQASNLETCQPLQHPSSPCGMRSTARYLRIYL